MNPVLDVIFNRKSIRAYDPGPIDRQDRDTIVQAAIRAPTAGNLMLYSIIEVTDQAVKDRLVHTCDNQPFIARAPLVLLFLADFQRLHDYILHCGVGEACRQQGIPMRRPEEGDLLLACCDALIAAQTAVIAAESLGIGSCYVGDILENYEVHQQLFDLPPYVFPICLVCFGRPTAQQKERELTPRFDRRFIAFENRYRRLTPSEFDEMFQPWHERTFAGRSEVAGATTVGQLIYNRKVSADYAREMTRSVRAMLAAWLQG
jgi:FMN reductase (NADPH)/FMN reductase [NAD(P)H]